MAGALMDKAEDLRQILANDKLSDKAKIEAANEAINEVELDDVECLTEELGQWRDGMSGTNLENTGKYQELEDAISTLENIDTSFEDVTETDQIDEAADKMEETASELESIEFPGMY